MLGGPAPAAASVFTETTPASPTRPSRLRGLSYLRNYTHNHLHSALSPRSPDSSSTHPLLRSTSSPGSTATLPSVAPQIPGFRTPGAERPIESTATIQSGENGWIPTIQGRSGLSREAPQPTSTSRESAASEPHVQHHHYDESSSSYFPVADLPPTTDMTRRRANTTLVPTAASLARLPSSNDAPQIPPLPSSALTSPFSMSASNSTGSNSQSTADAPSTTNGGTNSNSKDHATIRFIPHEEPRSTRPSLQFTAVTRTIKSSAGVVRVGRYSERDHGHESGHHLAIESPDGTPAPVGFKSKVVSRRHCEFWYEPSTNQWSVKDVGSSSGTFLNHVRLSSPGHESRAFPVRDGDVVQLGIDFKGGEEVIFRCVKIRVECNRGWQKSLNSFNTSAHRRLLQNAGVSIPGDGGKGKRKKRKTKGGRTSKRNSDAGSVGASASSECSICLNPVSPCQALFVAPCSHVWHFKCIQSLLSGPQFPHFLCPNCRFVSDLDADVEEPEEEEEEDLDEDVDDGEEEKETVEDIGANGQAANVERELLHDGIEDASRQQEEVVTAGGMPLPERDQQATPRASAQAHAQPPREARSNGDLDADLVHTLQQTHLGDEPSASSTNPPSALKQPAAALHHSGMPPSQPIAIDSPRHSSSHLSLPRGGGASGQATSTMSEASSLSNGVSGIVSGGLLAGDGPMTPRNDAGPFVLDGSGGGILSGILNGGIPSLGGESDEATTEEEGRTARTTAASSARR